MRVSASPYLSTLYERPNIKSKIQSTQNSYSSTQVKAMTEQGATSPSSIWDELSQEYDIHHATFEEFCTMSKRLYDTRQITLADHAILTLDPTKTPGPNKANFLTPADQFGRRDWIAEWKAQAKMQLKTGDVSGYHNVMNNIVHGILERLERK